MNPHFATAMDTSVSTRKPPRDAPTRLAAMESNVRALEARLADTVELLHLWQNEAYSYRLLAEAVAMGLYSAERAKQALAKGAFGPGDVRLAFLPLAETEHRAFGAIAAFAQLAPQEFLWVCLDAVMGNSDDEDLLQGCAEAARRRFRDGVLSDWAR